MGLHFFQCRLPMRAWCPSIPMQIPFVICRFRKWLQDAHNRRRRGVSVVLRLKKGAEMNQTGILSAAAAGTFTIGDDLTVNRMGYGAMRITGQGVWGPPAN